MEDGEKPSLEQILAFLEASGEVHFQARDRGGVRVVLLAQLGQVPPHQTLRANGSLNVPSGLTFSAGGH